MATVSIDEATRTLPALLQRARLESIVIRDKDGDCAMILSLKPKTEEERRKAWERLEETSRRASAELAASLAVKEISVEDFLADALADE